MNGPGLPHFSWAVLPNGPTEVGEAGFGFTIFTL
jgi:hypothetical protein